MKNILLLFIALGTFTIASGQQEEQFTQFMFNKQSFNPAFVGQDRVANISAIMRNQWVGIDGAPQTQMINFNTPLAQNRIGIGASIARQTIGVTENYTADAAYAYHIELGRGRLGLGVQASVRLLQVNFSELQGTQPIETDGAVPMDFQSRYVPNFGAGFYYGGQNMYVGFSIPRLLENNIDLADSRDVVTRETRHFYFMSGARFDIGDKIEVQPQILLKYVMGAPFDGDVNVNFTFVDKFIAGASYRIGGPKTSGAGESISALLGTYINDNILFGLSYDATLTELKNYNSGSFEGVLRYFFGGKPNEAENVDDPLGRNPFFN